MINGCTQLREGPSRKDTAQITFLPSVANLEGWLAIPKRQATIDPSNSLWDPAKRGGIRCFDFVLAESGSQVLEGIPADLLRFRAGLLDVNTCVLKFRSYPFIFVSKGLELVCQPGDLLVEHVEVCRRRWRWCG